MDTIKLEKKNTRMIAHAGLLGLESPNTIAGFIAAGNRSHYGIETDLQPTGDGQIAVIHNDDTVSITGVHRSVRASTLAELQQLPVYDRPFFYDLEKYGYQPQEGKFRSDLRIPALSEFVAICKKYGKVAVPELKEAWSEEEIALAVEEFRKQDHLQNTVFISFCWENLEKIRALVPDQKVQFLTDEKMVFTDEFLDRVAENGFDLDIHIFTVTKELVERIHARGIVVNVWTVDWPERAAQLVDWGVDFITSNIIE